MTMGNFLWPKFRVLSNKVFLGCQWEVCFQLLQENLNICFFWNWRVHSLWRRSLRIKFARGISLNSRNFFSEFSIFGTLSSNVKVSQVISWNGYNPLQRIFPSNSQHFDTLQLLLLFRSRLFFVKSPSNVWWKHSSTKNGTEGFMIHSCKKWTQQNRIRKEEFWRDVLSVETFFTE